MPKKDMKNACAPARGGVEYVYGDGDRTKGRRDTETMMETHRHDPSGIWTHEATTAARRGLLGTYANRAPDICVEAERIVCERWGPHAVITLTTLEEALLNLRATRPIA